MDFSRFAPNPLIDCHVHLRHAELAGDLTRIMNEVGLTAVNALAVPHAPIINQNAALVDFKARFPRSAFVSGALDHVELLTDLDRVPERLAHQIQRLKAIGFDGLKLIESKPTDRLELDFPLDGPFYAPMWEALEVAGLPVLWHVADPEEFWDFDACPDWAHAHGWFYDQAYPLKEALYAEVETVLTRHPGLRVVLAHFYCLSADLPRAAAFLDRHLGASFDLAPGIEMYLNFARDVEATRDFFLTYSDRILHGTDIGAGSSNSDHTIGIDRNDAHGRTWLIRRFLEGDDTFDSPAELGHGLGMDVRGLHGIALSGVALARIYAGNFHSIYGSQPASLDLSAAIEELDRQAAALHARAGAPTDSPARRVGRLLGV